MAYTSGSVRDSRSKVFCFFFSKKKCFLPLYSIRVRP